MEAGQRVRYSIGIDAGSVATKGVLFDGCQILDHVLIPTGWSPRNAADEVLVKLLAPRALTQADVLLTATGYGGRSITLAQKVITEITCHAKGAHFLNNQVRTIIDIGGQDSKAISVNERGEVVDFLMNDKCAAGTGRFLEVMVNLLGADIKELDDLTRDAEPQLISSMCTVFAESEVIGLLARGVAKESVARGIVQSIAVRTASLAGKINVSERVLFTGGLAQSERIRTEVGRLLEIEIETSPLSQLAGALGAAVIGWNRLSV